MLSIKRQEEILEILNKNKQATVEELAADVPATVSVIIMDAKTERLVAAAANTYADISGARRQAGSIVKPLLKKMFSILSKE